jgi:hypothetical protein
MLKIKDDWSNAQIIDLIVEQLLEVPENEIVTYSELCALTGRDLQFEHRHLLDSAFKITLEKHNVLFDNKRNIGYERLSDADRVSRLDGIAKARRTSLREARKDMVQNYDNLRPEQQSRHNAKMAIYAAISCMASDASVKKIEAVISNDDPATNIKLVMERLKDVV